MSHNAADKKVGHITFGGRVTGMRGRTAPRTGRGRCGSYRITAKLVEGESAKEGGSDGREDVWDGGSEGWTCRNAVGTFAGVC